MPGMDEPGGGTSTDASVRPGSASDEPRTRAFLFCDLFGYTAFVEAYGDQAAAELLERYRAVVRAAVAAERGAEITAEGDSISVVFDSAKPAVRCGLTIVAAAATEGSDHPDAPIRVGVGIHAGESVEGAGGSVGSAVDIAARICAQAAPGEVLVSDTVRGLVRTSLKVTYEARGRPTLEGIPESIALYRVLPRTSTVVPARRSLTGGLGLRGLVTVVVVVLVSVALLVWRLSGAAAPGASPTPSAGAWATTAAASASASLATAQWPALTSSRKPSERASRSSE